MHRLRAKIELDPHDPVHLQTVHGEGYRFVTVPPAAEPPGPPAGRPLARLRGRDEAVARVLAHLADDRRLVSITGPAGMGKTALAREVAWQATRDPGRHARSWWVDLACCATPAEAQAQLARALDGDPPAPAGGQDLARASRGLGAGATLVVLDGLDRLGDDAPGVVEALLGHSAGLALVVTRRARLQLPGETVLWLEPLPAGDAFALFRDELARHGALGAEVAGDEGSPAVVDHLGGVPLAVVLAASVAASLGLAVLHEELARGRAQWGVGATRALNSAMELSWSMLTPAERAVLRQCALLSEPVDTAVLRAACGPLGADRPLSRILADLVDRGVLVGAPRRDGQRNFRIAPFVRDFLAQAVGPDAPAHLRRGPGPRNPRDGCRDDGFGAAPRSGPTRLGARAGT